MKKILLCICASLFCASVMFAQNKTSASLRYDVPLDSIRMSDPFVYADRQTMTYYMTGTGGKMWKSKNLKTWTGPFHVTDIDSLSWMGSNPMIWAAEIHKYKGKYFYFATFTNKDVHIDTVDNNVIDRRSCQVLQSDDVCGPYTITGDSVFLPADKPTLDGTLWLDTDGKPYMVYCYEWLQNRNGTIEKILMKDDLSGTIGEGTVLFRASDSPWSREKDASGHDKPNKVTDGPFLFKTKSGRLGMIWSSWIYDVYTQGVAYSVSGTLDGPWVQDPEPVTPANYGHGMMFRDFNGRILMVVHSHARNASGNVVRVPHFFIVDLSGDKLDVVREYIP